METISYMNIKKLNTESHSSQVNVLKSLEAQ